MLSHADRATHSRAVKMNDHMCEDHYDDSPYSNVFVLEVMDLCTLAAFLRIRTLPHVAVGHFYSPERLFAISGVKQLDVLLCIGHKLLVN